MKIRNYTSKDLRPLIILRLLDGGSHSYEDLMAEFCSQVPPQKAQVVQRQRCRDKSTGSLQGDIRRGQQGVIHRTLVGALHDGLIQRVGGEPPRRDANVFPGGTYALAPDAMDQIIAAKGALGCLVNVLVGEILKGRRFRLEWLPTTRSQETHVYGIGLRGLQPIVTNA